jgi:hypothetical protein
MKAIFFFLHKVDLLSPYEESDRKQRFPTTHLTKSCTFPTQSTTVARKQGTQNDETTIFESASSLLDISVFDVLTHRRVRELRKRYMREVPHAVARFRCYQTPVPLKVVEAVPVPWFQLA